MVDQRRISISPHTGGIRNSELVLGTWKNYFYIWLKFYWETTGGSKIRITDAPVSKDISESPTDQYYAWVYNNKLENRLIIISGCLGTLKDRWNFWTCGIKVYNKHNSYLQIRLIPCPHTLQIFMDKTNNCSRNWLVKSKLIVIFYNDNKRGVKKMKGRNCNLLLNTNNNTNFHRTNNSQVNKEDLRTRLKLYYRQSNQQVELEDGKGLYISSYSLNNVSDLIRRQNQSQHWILILAKGGKATIIRRHRLNDGQHYGVLDKNIESDMKWHYGEWDCNGKNREEENIRMTSMESARRQTQFCSEMMSDVEEATGERPGLGRHARLHSFSEMIRSCLRGIGPGGCVLLIKQRSASTYFILVVIITLSVGELKCEMTDIHWLLLCWVGTSHMLTYEILWRRMTLKHYSVCMLSLHTHHVHDMCLRCVGMLRTGVGCDVVICSPPRNLGTQLALANRDDNTQTNWVDRTVGTCRGNRITGGMIKEAVTGLPLGTQLELSHRDCRTQTLLVDWTYKQHRSAVYMYYPPKWPVFYNPCVPLEYGRDVVTCFQPRHLGTQLEMANRDHSILTLLEDRTVGTSRSNRMTGGRNKDAVTGLPRQMGTQLEEAMEREKQIYIKQYKSATSERKAELEGKIEIVDNQVQSQLRTPESLREDAIEQANQDGVILSDAQLRNVV